jgi:hypothetical protein
MRRCLKIRILAYVDVPDTQKAVRAVLNQKIQVDGKKTQLVKNGDFYRLEHKSLLGWNSDYVYFRTIAIDIAETRIEIEYRHEDGQGQYWDTLDMLEFGRTNNSAQSTEMLNAQVKVSRWLVKFIEMFNDKYHIHYGKT